MRVNFGNSRRFKKNLSKVLYSLRNWQKSQIIKLWKVQDLGRSQQQEFRDIFVLQIHMTLLISPVQVQGGEEGSCSCDWLVVPPGTHRMVKDSWSSIVLSHPNDLDKFLFSYSQDFPSVDYPEISVLEYYIMFQLAPNLHLIRRCLIFF